MSPNDEAGAGTDEIARCAAEFQDSGAFLQAILGCTPECIVAIDVNGVIRFINRLAPGQDGVIVGASVFDYLAPESHEAARACYENVARTGRPDSYECIAVDLHRRKRRYRTRVGPIVSGGEVVGLTLIYTDTTEVQALELRHQESLEKLQVALSASGIGLWSWDRQRDHLSWDGVIGGLFGVRGADVPSTYEAWMLTVHADDRARVEDTVARALQTGTFDDVHYRVMRADGTARWLLVRGKAIRDARGVVVKLMGGVVDITERMVAEEALRRSEERFRATFNQAAVGLAHVALDGQWLRLNERYCEIVGYTQEELRKLSFADITYSQDLPVDLQNMAKLLSGDLQTISTSKRYVHREGRLVWVNVTVSLVRSETGAPCYFIAVAEDITARKLTEEALANALAREQAARQRAAFLAEASRALAGSLDPMTTLQTLTRLAVPRLADTAVVELVDEHGQLGPNHPVVVAATDPEQEAIFQEMRRRFPPMESGPIPEVLRTGRSKIVSHKTERPRWEERGAEQRAMLARVMKRFLLIVPLAARGQRLGVMALGSDERAYGADDLELIEELGRRSGLAIDNARLYQQARSAIRVRDEFLSIASHELKTPLTPVLLRVQNLLRLVEHAEGSALPAGVVRPKLEGIQAQLGRLSRLIEDLLDISKISAGRLSIEREEVDLTALLEEVLSRHAEALRRAGCALVYRAEPQIKGSWDRLRLEQIVHNLLSNAVKYGAGKPIEVTLTGDDAVARLVVRDHGIGLAPADQERIFQRFERAVSERHYGGFGLGLWITRQVVEAMGGTIRVSSAPGEGATFTVELPRGPR